MAQPTRVLIADDSTHAREGLRALLSTWPNIMLVGEAVNGQEALHLVAERRTDIVLLDLQMPLLDGIQATRLIKQQWPAVIVIVLTIYAAERDAALAAGADSFVIKGGNPKRLLDLLGVGVAGEQP